MSPLVVWPSVLGLSAFAVGLYTYRGEIFGSGRTAALELEAGARRAQRFFSLGVVFMALALATFSGEHFTQARGFSQLVPKILPGRLFIAYLVGAALIAAAMSFATRTCMRWSAPLLALMFALFVLLMDLPTAIRRSGAHFFWIFPAREGTFALGALCAYACGSQAGWARSGTFATILRLWTALVIVYYGIMNILHPEFAPGVPDRQPTSAWVPLHLQLAYLVGAIMIALGMAMLFKKAGVAAIRGVGILMTTLAIALFGPDLVLANSVNARITAINFVGDTLFFAGTMFAIGSAVAMSQAAAAVSQD